MAEVANDRRHSIAIACMSKARAFFLLQKENETEKRCLFSLSLSLSNLEKK
jgi:hypothetical protein